MTRRVLALVSAALLALSPLFASPLSAAPAKKAAKPAAEKSAAPRFSNAYSCPKNKTLAKRAKTQYIILHTTEGAKAGSLQKLRANGECHYLVDEAGVIYRIVDRRRIAFHCGLSMWNSVTDINRYSIGIEIVGYHNKEITAAQYASLKYLLADLKRIYKVRDENILTHSMVAYDKPNPWHKKNHRGRKRCAMLLADSARRRKMGVYSKPSYDPDLKAGRLTDADPALTRILYGGTNGKTPAKPASTPAKPAVTATKPAPSAPPQKSGATGTPAASASSNVIGPKNSAWDIAKEQYNAATTLYRFPNGTVKKGTDITNWKAVPPGTVVTLPQKAPVVSPAPATPATSATPAAIASSSNVIGPKNSAWDIARDRYNAATTLYRFPNGMVKKGSDIRDWKAMPAGTVVTMDDSDEENNDSANGLLVLGKDSNSVRDLVGDEALSDTTFYIEPGAKTYRKGSSMTQAQVDALPGGTRILVRYAVGGPISAKKRVFDICGANWNRPETYYLTPRGELKSGEFINEKNIPTGSWVFYWK